MIHAIAWCCAESLGYLGADGRSWKEPSPDLSESVTCPPVLGRSIRNYPRMPLHARRCLCAGVLALQAARWPGRGVEEIGLVSAGYAGCLAADRRYFQDYNQHGRTIGLGNLFIYTLATSSLGELAITEKLTGPTLHIQDDLTPVAGLLRHAQNLVAEHEADGMLALWGDLDAVVCLAVGGEESTGIHPVLSVTSELVPLEWAQRLAAKTNTGC